MKLGIILIAATMLATSASAQQHSGHGNRSPGGWHAGAQGPHSGWQGQRSFGPHPRGYRGYGYYPRYGHGYRYFAPPVIGYVGPSYYAYPAEPYYYEYVEPPTVVVEMPPIAQVVPPSPPPAPPPRPTAPAAPPEPVKPAPQPTPAPKTFERFTLSASELFEFDRAELKLPQPKLDQMAAVMNANPQIGNVRIIGYTDRLGSDAYNLRLSQRRADAVKAYFVSKGVAANRLVAIGRGEADPIVFCEQRERNALIECLRANRRVVVEPITVERPR